MVCSGPFRGAQDTPFWFGRWMMVESLSPPLSNSPPCSNSPGSTASHHTPRLSQRFNYLCACRTQRPFTPGDHRAIASSHARVRSGPTCWGKCVRAQSSNTEQSPLLAFPTQTRVPAPASGNRIQRSNLTILPQQGCLVGRRMILGIPPRSFLAPRLGPLLGPLVARRGGRGHGGVT